MMNYMAEANAIAARLRPFATPVADQRVCRPSAPPVAGRKARPVGAVPVAGPGVRGPSAVPSPRSLEVLAFMRAFFAQNDQLPPMSHIARHFGWSRNVSAHWHVSALVRHGLVERNVCGKLRFARGAGGVQ